MTNALAVARDRGYRSVAFPLIGAGSGGFDEGRALAVMRDTLEQAAFDGEVRIVLFSRAARKGP